MIIYEPKLNFANSQRAFRKYVEKYNIGKESREKLKPAHFAQFYTYLRLLQRNIAQDNNRAINGGYPDAMAFETDTSVFNHLFTNNTEMRKQLDGGHHSTFIRRAERLKKAGVIFKIKHGSQNNYEIVINPYLLWIDDLSGKPNTLRPDLDLAARWEPERILNISSVAKCEQNIVSLKEHSNKKIINQAESISSGNSQKKPAEPHEIDNLFNKRIHPKDTTENVAKSDFGATVLSTIKSKIELKKSEKSVAPAENESYSDRYKRKNNEVKLLKRQYAAMMVQLMIDYLTAGITIFDGERKKAISYVAEHYFSETYTFTALERKFETYMRRLEDARRFKELHPEYHPTPFLYFQLDNKKGFNSPTWVRNQVKWEKLKENRIKHNRLMAAIHRIDLNPTYECYKREIEYVRKNIPDKLKQFFAAMYQKHSELTKQKRA